MCNVDLITTSWSIFRSLFGPSVGPVAKPVPQTGRVQNVFEGVKVRSQPLPLKIPSNQPQPVVQAQQPSQIIQPQPFLQVGGGAAGATVTSVSSIAGASAGGGSIVHIAGANGSVVAQQVAATASTPQAAAPVQVQGTVYNAGNSTVTSSTTGPTPPNTPSPPFTTGQQQNQQPGSPILTNLLHRGGGGAPEGDVKPKVEEVKTFFT